MATIAEPTIRYAVLSAWCERAGIPQRLDRESGVDIVLSSCCHWAGAST